MDPKNDASLQLKKDEEKKDLLIGDADPSEQSPLPDITG
jgi:hypothetical protein